MRGECSFPLGGPKFFDVGKGGDQFFCHRQKGGPEKIGDRPSQTDAPPPPGKKMIAPQAPLTRKS